MWFWPDGYDKTILISEEPADMLTRIQGFGAVPSLRFRRTQPAERRSGSDLPPIFSPGIMRLSPVFVRLHQRCS